MLHFDARPSSVLQSEAGSKGWKVAIESPKRRASVPQRVGSSDPFLDSHRKPLSRCRVDGMLESATKSPRRVCVVVRTRPSYLVK